MLDSHHQNYKMPSDEFELEFNLELDRKLELA